MKLSAVPNSNPNRPSPACSNRLRKVGSEVGRKRRERGGRYREFVNCQEVDLRNRSVFFAPLILALCLSVCLCLSFSLCLSLSVSLSLSVDLITPSLVSWFLPALWSVLRCLGLFLYRDPLLFSQLCRVLTVFLNAEKQNSQVSHKMQERQEYY